MTRPIKRRREPRETIYERFGVEASGLSRKPDEGTEAFWDRIWESLTAEQQTALNDRIETHDREDVAEALGVPVERVTSIEVADDRATIVIGPEPEVV